MADVELVIKVPEHCFEELKRVELNESNEGVVFHTIKCILNGTPLPKGHGTLKNADELHSIFKEKCDAYNIDNLSFMSDMDMNFDLAPTIIEADEEED